MNIGKRIKEARQNANMTQEALANKISNDNVTFGATAISNWERGYSKPDADTVYLLCKALNVDANYIFDWSSELENENPKNTLINALKKKGFLSKENDDITEEDLKVLLEFAEKNKDFIIKK